MSRLTHVTITCHKYRQKREILSQLVSHLQSTSDCYSISPTMFLARSATNGTEPGLLCARRFDSLQQDISTTQIIQGCSTCNLEKLCLWILSWQCFMQKFTST